MDCLFFEHKLKDEISPLELVNSKMLSSIINKRKRKLIRRKQNEFYLEARKKGEIK